MDLALNVHPVPIQLDSSRNPSRFEMCRLMSLLKLRLKLAEWSLCTI